MDFMSHIIEENRVPCWILRQKFHGLSVKQCKQLSTGAEVCNQTNMRRCLGPEHNALAMRSRSWIETKNRKIHLKGSVESGKERMIQKGNDFSFDACSVNLYKSCTLSMRDIIDISFLRMKRELILHHIPCYDLTSWFSPLPSWRTTHLCLSVQPNEHCVSQKSKTI